MDIQKEKDAFHTEPWEKAPQPQSVWKQGWTFQEELFSVEEMYGFVERFACENGLEQTEAALPFMKQSHAGQVRKGSGRVPYIYHPLTMACHSIAMGLTEDELLAAILLHDVCEDCGIAPEQLPVNKTVQEAVDCLTFRLYPGMPKAQAKARYFENLRGNRLAAVIKLFDRCSNVSAMAGGFTKERMVQYILETETSLMPLFDVIRSRYRGYEKALFLLEYQIRSLLESLKRLL